MFKLSIVIATLFATAIHAVPLDPAHHPQATSYVTFNDNQNAVQHVQLAAVPTVQKYLTQAAHPASLYTTAPHQPSAALYASHPDLTQVSYPATVTKVAAAVPAVQKYIAQPAHHQLYSTAAVQAPLAGALYNPGHPIVQQQYAVQQPIAAYQQPIAAYQQTAVPAHLTKVVAKTYEQPEEYAPAHYEYGYTVQDPHSGDFHSQQEQRQGDQVVGQYSLQEADGTVRIVKYSDDGHGFNAVVEKQGHPTEAPATLYKKTIVGVPAPVQAVHAAVPQQYAVASHY